MIICPFCNTQLSKNDFGYKCQKCERSYREQDGIFQLISEETIEDCFFASEKFDVLYQSEEKNFWFKVRNKIIGKTMTRYLSPQSRILEVGCGTGYVSRYLKEMGYHVECADIFIDALQFCKRRNAGFQYYQFNLMDKIFIQEFDAICAFDVLEHIDDDVTTLKNLNNALKPNGMLFITVPADMRLWSQKDISARHKRRYSIRELEKKVEEGGFKVIKLSYFMTLLFPVILLSRRVSMRTKKKNQGESLYNVEKEEMGELQPNRILNFLFYYIFILELPPLLSFNLPFGSSLLCVAVKRK